MFGCFRAKQEPIIRINTKMKQNNIKKSELASKIGMSSRTIAKIAKGEKLADNVVLRLCEYFGCRKEDIVVEVCDNKILQALRDEKSTMLSGGIYHETQVRLPIILTVLKAVSFRKTRHV